MLAKARNENTALADTTRQRFRSQATQDPAQVGSPSKQQLRSRQHPKSENGNQDVNEDDHTYCRR
jgi:hypothetical protein